MSGEFGTNIPLQIQRQLRKQSQYGCAMCGCPLLRYAHIVPYNRIQAFLPENMIPLCPSHYAKYDNGDFSDSLLRDAKRNPHNRLHPQDVLHVDSEEMVINVGKCKFINTYRILVVNDFDLITITRDSGKYLLLDINFFDKIDNLIATISENSWVAEKTTEWEIIYTPQKNLSIQNLQRNITFELAKQDMELFITGVLHYDGSTVRITRNEILLDESEIGTEHKNSVLKNYDCGIAAHT